MAVICFHNPNGENGYLSNWYPAAFTKDGITFSTMEQYMMYRKAVCFGDVKVAEQILATEDVAEIKALGRLVSGYDESLWNGVRHLRKQLKETGSAVLAECAVKDRIWGIGLSMHDPDRLDQVKWKGQNLLGYTLMMVRDRL